MVHHNSESSLVVEVKSKKHLYQPLIELKESVVAKLNETLYLGGGAVLRYQGRLCVPNVDELRNRILEETHGSRYSIHPCSTKMYHDLIRSVLAGRLKEGQRNLLQNVQISNKCKPST